MRSGDFVHIMAMIQKAEVPVWIYTMKAKSEF